MRTIKFRGKTEIGQWVYGNLFVPDKIVRGVYICPTTNYADFAPNYEDGDDIEESMKKGCALCRFIEVIPSAVGQFTGLLDKDGKEVYEGDILKSDKFGYGYSIVKFGEYPDGDGLATNVGFYFLEDHEQFGFGKDCMGKSDNYIVIGNIHDNPELL